MGIEIPQEDPTPADQWPSARRRGFTVELPSGAKATIRRTLDLPALIKSGKIPNPLGNLLAEVITRQSENLEEGKSRDEQPFKFSDVANVDTINAMMELVDEVCVRTFISPKVALPPEDAGDEWEPPEGTLSIHDLTLDDKMFVWQYAMGGSADLSSFRAATTSAVTAALNGTDVSLPSEQPAGAH